MELLVAVITLYSFQCCIDCYWRFRSEFNFSHDGIVRQLQWTLSFNNEHVCLPLTVGRLTVELCSPSSAAVLTSCILDVSATTGASPAEWSGLSQPLVVAMSLTNMCFRTDNESVGLYIEKQDSGLIRRSEYVTGDSVLRNDNISHSLRRYVISYDILTRCVYLFQTAFAVLLKRAQVILSPPSLPRIVPADCH